MRDTLIVVLALGLAACSKGRSDQPAATSPAPVAEEAPRRAVSSLKITLPPGWTRNDADNDMIIFTSPKLPDGRDTVARIDHAGGRAVATAKELIAARIEHHWDKGVTAEIVKEEPMPGGFAATARVTAPVDPQHPKLEYYSIWKVEDQVLFCECEWVPDEAIRDQIASLCNSAHF